MELILQHGMLPRPPQRGLARNYLLKQRTDPLNTRWNRDHRVFPEFSPAETSHLFTAAAAASAATALSLEALKAARLSQFTAAENLKEDTTNEQYLRQEEQTVPSSVDEIWTAAWAGLRQVDDTNKELNRGYAADDAPITTPLLWLQGLRGDARRRLLALSLAALESAIENPKNSTSPVVDTDTGGLSSSVVLERCNSILRESSTEAAKAWLGYLPSALEQAIVESTSNRSVGNENLKENAGGSRVDLTAASSSSFRVDWYAVEERLSVYCSVIRLLQSSQIITSSSSSSTKENNEEEEEETFRSPAVSETNLPVSVSLRAAAKASLLSNSSPTIDSLSTNDPLSMNYRSNNISGWRATQAGTTSQSQLLALAPSVVQDMAVRIADMVAAAYLVEASQGTWTPSLSETTNSTSRRASKIKDSTGRRNTAAGESAVTGGNYSTAGAVATPLISGTNNNKLSASSASSAASSSSLEASWWPVYAHPRVASTRQLQRFSNRLLLSRWIDTTFHSVVAAYDDRLPLFTLSAPGGLLRVRQAPVRRAAQLSALTGLRYYVSLVLEAVDAAAPTLRVLWDRATAAVAWLLTYGLGKGLGLVWKGLQIGLASAAISSGKAASTTKNSGGVRSKSSNSTGSTTDTPSSVKMKEGIDKSTAGTMIFIPGSG